MRRSDSNWPILLMVAAGASSVLWQGCGDDGGAIDPTYDNVVMVLDTSCSSGSTCHGGRLDGKARLNFETAIREGDVTQVLSGVAACEYDAMPRVDPGNPDGSWLMFKLEGPHDADGNLEFTPSATWAPATDADCPERTTSGEITFGVLMPFSLDGPRPLADREITMFRRWIETGAPGPGI